jgi:AraC-like DNA-binding protein/quercetin dioxygenase-like cupin family protein
MSKVPFAVEERPEVELSAEKYLPTRFPLSIMDVEQGAIAPHTHEFWEVVYVRRGRGEHRVGERRFAMATGDVYVIRPGERHSYGPRTGETTRIVNVLWMPALLDGMPAEPGGAIFTEPDRSPLLRLRGRESLRVESLLDEMRREQGAPQEHHEAVLRHLFCALMLLLSRARPHAESETDEASERGTRGEAAWRDERALIERAVEWVETNHRRTVRVEQVASHVALSPSRLSHLFKAHTGRGVIEYLHAYRVARAGHLLCSTQSSSQEIAREVGFGDARFFRRVFARHTGCAPTHFRRHFGA